MQTVKDEGHAYFSKNPFCLEHCTFCHDFHGKAYLCGLCYLKAFTVICLASSRIDWIPRLDMIKFFQSFGRLFLRVSVFSLFSSFNNMRQGTVLVFIFGKIHGEGAIIFL